MTKADEVRAEYEAAIEVAELEDEYAALKASGGRSSERGREVANRLRELRCVYRLAREGFAIVDGEIVERVDATASPDPVAAVAAVHGGEG